MNDFPMINRLPPYVFTVLDQKKVKLREQGFQLIDFGMGNPDQPTSPDIVGTMTREAITAGADAYAPSNGILELRKAICKWYKRSYAIELDFDKETIVTIGSKEGLAHLALATTGTEDRVLVPDPCYPIHKYAFAIAGATVVPYNALDASNLVESIKIAIANTWPKPKALVLNYPSNPTTEIIDLATFSQLVELAKQENFWILHDLAYADLTFEGERAPSILQVPGAKEVAVEAFTLSKSFNMPGWRVGFMSGNEKLVGALKHLKNYLDYGMYRPLQYAAIEALTASEELMKKTRELYHTRRDILCTELNKIGWQVPIPKATMFIWAKIPEAYKHLKSMKFTELLLEHAQVVVSPGCCFGENGDDYVRFSLIQDEDAVLQACKMMEKMFREGLGSITDQQTNAA